MLFTDCQNMKSTDENNRQSINLSKSSQKILTKDKDMLEADHTDGYSSIINHIFQSFYYDAEASVPIACERERERIKEIINPTDDSTINMVEKLVQNYREIIEKNVKERIKKKENRVLIRFDKDTLSLLAAEDAGQMIASFYAEHYQNKVGFYMKALIEEYCELPYPEREKIYFHNTILPAVREAVEDRKQLKVVLHRSSNGKNNVLYIKPYMPKPILTDSEDQYNYLVGICKSNDPEYNPRPGSIRLTSIKECRVVGRSGSGTLTKKDLTDIEKAISEYGVQYLSDNNIIELTVKFTERGEHLYLRSIFHLRPAYEGLPDKNNRIYKFRCPRNQARFYFFRYGEDVKIIEPEDLAEEFRKKYEKAANQYEESPLYKSSNA